MSQLARCVAALADDVARLESGSEAIEHALNDYRSPVLEIAMDMSRCSKTGGRSNE